MIGIASFAALVFALKPDPLVRVEGPGTCPSSDEVARRLERFLPPRPVNVEPDRATLEVEEDVLHLVLLKADGTLVGDKRLERKASCAEIAEAVAVIIAIWEHPLRPGLVPPIDPSLASMALGEARADKGGAGQLRSPAGTPTDGSAAVAVEVPKASAKQRVVAMADAAERSRAASDLFADYPDTAPPRFERDVATSKPGERGPAWRVEAGAAVRGLYPSMVPGALLEAVIRRGAAGWGARFDLGGAWWSDADVETGSVSWTRLTAGAGLVQDWSYRRVFLGLREEILGGALVATSRGFDRTQTRAVVEPGAEIGLRTGVWVTSSFSLWTDFGLTLWPLNDELRVEGVSQTVKANRWVGALSVGGTIATGR
jgi:hypothetical protein